MALIVVLTNISKLAPVSDYRVEVYVNHVQIAGPMLLKGHSRDQGWEALVKQLAKGLKVSPYKPRKAVMPSA